MEKDRPKYKNDGVTSFGQIFSENTSVQQADVLQYGFVNLGNQPVMINGVFLDRYYTGGIGNPTVIAGSFNEWWPPVLAGEKDTGNYNVTFLNTFYGAVLAQPRLLVIRKSDSPRK